MKRCLCEKLPLESSETYGGSEREERERGRRRRRRRRRRGNPLFHPPTSPPASTLLAQVKPSRAAAAHFLPDHIRKGLPLCCYGSAQLPRSPWQLSQPQSHRDVDANIHTHTLLYMLTHTCLHLLANKNTTGGAAREKRRGRAGLNKSEDFTHKHSYNTLRAVLLAAAYANDYSTAPVQGRCGL